MQLTGPSKYSPLFVDTEFVPAKLHYLTLCNQSKSSIPTVLPFPDEDITLGELTSTISRVLPTSSIIQLEQEELCQSPSMLHLPECSSVKELKEKAGRHWINGEELFCSSESDIRLEQLVQKKEMEKEGGERCDLCCIMLANKSDVIHLSLVWQSEEAAREEILEQVNQLYGVTMSINQLKFHQLTFQCSTEEELTSIRYIHKPASALQQIIFQTQGLAFIGISVISNRLSAANFCRQKPPATPRCIELIVNEFQAYKMDYDMIKRYQVKEILGIFSLKAPETKGLKIMGQVYKPATVLSDIEVFYSSGALLNHLTAQLVEEIEAFQKGINQQSPLTEHELRKLSQNCSRVEKSFIKELQKSKMRREVTPLSLFNSDFQINSYRLTSFKLFYHIIHKYIRNYFTHFNSYFDKLTSGRFVSALYEQINTLPVFQGETWRKLDYELPCQQGEEVTFNNFIITTKRKSIFELETKNRRRCKQTFIKIFSETGREVGQHTSFDGLEQVVFQPYTKFSVTSRIQDEKRIYLVLQQTVAEPVRPRSSVILWVDDKVKQGKEMFKQIRKFKATVLLFQLLSTAQLLQWIESHKSLIAGQGVNFIMISNMRRIEAGKENTIAGIEAVRYASTLIPSCKIILYIGSIENTRANLIKNQIDPNSLFITNTSTQLLHKLSAECEHNNQNEVPSLDKLEENNMKDLLAYLKHSENNMPFELVKDPTAIKEAHKAVKSPPMKPGIKNVMSSKVEAYKNPEGHHPKGKVEQVQKQQKVAYSSQIFANEQKKEANVGFWMQEQLGNALKIFTKGGKKTNFI